MFRGVRSISLDSKGRIAIPSRYRAFLEERGQKVLVLTLSPLDPCLCLYPLEQWEVLEQKLESLNDFDKRSRRAKQMMLGYATDCEMDSHGRIRIPKEHQDFADLDKQISFVGQGKHFAIWNESVWMRETGEFRNSGDPGTPPGTFAF